MIGNKYFDRKTFTYNRNNKGPRACFWGHRHKSHLYADSRVSASETSDNDNILGVVSLIIWTLLTLVTVQYALIAMSLSRRGEGGTIVLKEILTSGLKSKRAIGFVSLVSFVGVSLLIGDGVITPAISILSAVEGSLLIPGLEGLSKASIVLISGMIAVGLFAVQSKGTEKVAGAFGPIMIVWFASLAVTGSLFIAEAPQILYALNPYLRSEVSG